MHTCFFVVISFAAVAFANANPKTPVRESHPAQTKLRGSTRQAAGKPDLSDDTQPALPLAARQTRSDQHAAADDILCTSEGVTPGVCALASLARPLASSATLLSNSSGKPKGVNEDPGFLVVSQARSKLESALVREIETALAGNHTGFDMARLRGLEEELRPIFATLPRDRQVENSLGGLGLAAARYLLHQYFVRKYSWHVRGLDPAGDGRLPPDDKESLRSRVAGHLLKVMHKKVGKHGFSIKVLAVFVATLEHLFRGDQHELLKQVWSVYGPQSDFSMDGGGPELVLQVWLAHYIYSSKFDGGRALTPSSALQELEGLEEAYSVWPKLVSFLRGEVQKDRKIGHDMTLKDVSLIADRLLRFFGEVSGSMCHDMENNIKSFKGGEQGLVKLSDLRDLELVDESEEYLQELGALDLSTQDPYVIVPNYILSPSNCDMSTSFYDSCCPNTCETHKGHLERALASAKTSQLTSVLDIVQQRMDSALSADMRKSLSDIAAEHDGAIPIHGRAFADWLHKVFPRDCPRTRSIDFRGVTGDELPDGNAEFQPHVSVLVTDWLGV